jgi:group I intron endonuclease
MKNKLSKGSRSAIYSALLKHGYSNFGVDILEYCEPNKLITREQHYIDLLKPKYNICKTAGSRLGLKRKKR